MTRGVRPTAGELEGQADYELILELDQRRVVPFVLEWLRRPTPVLRAYQVLVLLASAATIWASAAAARGANGLTWGAILLQLAGGVLANVTALVALHELIHAIVYKALGAPRVSLGADWKRLVFYATADGFVVGREAFAILALTPLVLVSAVLVALAALAPSWGPFAVATAAIHAVHCAGDVALLNYMCSVEGREVYTYDDARHRVSYFYASR